MKVCLSRHFSSLSCLKILRRQKANFLKLFIVICMYAKHFIFNLHVKMLLFSLHSMTLVLLCTKTQAPSILTFSLKNELWCTWMTLTDLWTKLKDFLKYSLKTPSQWFYFSLKFYVYDFPWLTTTLLLVFF